MAVQTEISTESILNAVLQMPDIEFNRFIRKAKNLRNKKKSPEARESELLLKINSTFPVSERQRYDELYAKFKADNITENEYEEVLKLSDKFEHLNAKRLKYLGELADIRGKSLETVMRDLNIKPPQI